MSKEELKKQEKMLKKVAYYQETISTWRSNRMELGKQIMTLSGLAIGLLATFRSEINDSCSFFVWFFAGVLFIISMCLILWIFRQNSDYIDKMYDYKKKNVMKSKKSLERAKEALKRIEKSLERKERFAVWSFGGGVALTFVLAVYRVGLPF